ncbi:hypothetical protein [Yersinia phage PY100]|nr:hypothetical protein [Yersinia phage PY100]
MDLEKFEYDAVRGLLIWKDGNRFVPAGAPVGSFNDTYGILYANTDNTRKHVAEIILELNNIDFEGPVYHKNGCGIDNRIENLVFNKRIVKTNDLLRRNGNGNKWVVEVGEYPYKQFISKVDAINYRNKYLANNDEYFVVDRSLNGIINRLNCYIVYSQYYGAKTQEKVMEYVKDRALKAHLRDILSVDVDALKNIASVIDGDDTHIRPKVLDVCGKLSALNADTLATTVSGMFGLNRVLVLQAIENMVLDGELLNANGIISVKK